MRSQQAFLLKAVNSDSQSFNINKVMSNEPSAKEIENGQDFSNLRELDINSKSINDLKDANE